MEIRNFTVLRSLAYFLIDFQLLLFWNRDCVRRADCAQIDCHDKLVAFQDCFNKTMSEINNRAAKLQLLKTRINECLQKGRCVSIYIDAFQGNENHTLRNSPFTDQGKVHQCLRDFRANAKPLVHDCVTHLVPDAAFINRAHRESKWTIIQQAMNKTLLQRLCAENGNATEATMCIDQLFTPNDRVRKQQEQHFKQFCTATRQCRNGMGICRTEQDNARKAQCDCRVRIYEKFDDMRREIQSCAGISLDSFKRARKYHLPFMADCGSDPCESTWEALTHGHDQDDDTDNDADN